MYILIKEKYPKIAKDISEILKLESNLKGLGIDISFDTLIDYLDSKGYVIGIYSNIEKQGELFISCVRIKGNVRLNFLKGDFINSFLTRNAAMNAIVDYSLELLEKELK